MGFFLLCGRLPCVYGVVSFPTSSVALSWLLVAGVSTFLLACPCSSQSPSFPGFLCCFARGLGCARWLCLWLCALLLSGTGVFLLLPDCPSPSIRLWVYWFQWLLFSTGVSLPSRWGHPCGVEVWFVLDRNEGVVPPFGSGPLVSSWLDLQPLSAASLRALSLRVCCRMVLHMSVGFCCP